MKLHSGWFFEDRLGFIVLLKMMNVGEAFRLPAVKHWEFTETMDEFVTAYRRDGKPVPYKKMINIRQTEI